MRYSKDYLNNRRLTLKGYTTILGYENLLWIVVSFATDLKGLKGFLTHILHQQIENSYCKNIANMKFTQSSYIAE